MPLAALAQNPYVRRILEKFSNSRFFTISALLHLLIVLIFGGTVLYQAVQEPPDFEGGEGGFVSASETAVAPPQPQQQAVPQQTTQFQVQTPQQTASIQAITTTSTQPLNFAMNPVLAPAMAVKTTTTAPAISAPAPTNIGSAGLTRESAAAIAAFTGGWGKGSGSGTGVRRREFEFTAFLGQYQGGNWYSTVRRSGDKIVGGSLPNLLFIMSKWSKNKIKTNERNLKAIRLDSDELFTAKPPFIFMTGTRDFKLTDKEVEKLRQYVQLGGAIWGDASVPGLRSRFDIAFRREMRRVLPDKNKDFEPLPANHPIYTAGYFDEIKEVPAGINYYKLPIYALKIYDEVAVLYTANDYGDMWQVALGGDDPSKAQIDLTASRGQMLYTSPDIWSYRDSYIYNLNLPALVDAYKFGINIVIHLLTRWEDKTARVPKL